jgi:restriction system protein
MQNNEVIPAFEMLLNEIDEIVDGLTKEGAQLLTAGKYDDARALIEKVESINGIREKVQSLSEDWRMLSIKSTKKTGRNPRQRKPKSTARLEKGLRTPEDAFKLPLLNTLIEMGGAGRVSDILDRMEKHVQPILSDHDYEPLSSTDELRWRNTTKWARQDLVNEGLLDKDSPYGIWTITEKGRVWAEGQSQYSLENKILEKQTQNTFPKPQNGHTDRSVTLEQIIEVCHEIYHNGRDYNEAVKRVADRRGLKFHSYGI